MINDLNIKTAALPANPNVKQTGDNNVYVNNQSGGEINFNITIPSDNTGSEFERMLAVDSFSQNYYQLIVTADSHGFRNGIVSIPADAALSQDLVPNEILSRCSSLTTSGISELKTFPAIICMENTDYNGKTDPNQPALYGYIREITKAGPNIQISFGMIGTFNQYILCDKDNGFGLNMSCAITDLNRCAWSVYNINLFEAFTVAGLSHLPYPNNYGGTK